MAAARPKPDEGVELDNDVHWLEQMLLGADGKEFVIHARVKSYLILGAIGIVYFFVKKAWTGQGFDLDTVLVPFVVTHLLMKIVTPQKPVEAHGMAVYYEVRRIILGARRRRRAGSYRVAPYALLARTAKTPRSWHWSGLLAWATKRRNRTDA